MKVPFSTPSVTARERSAVDDCLKSLWWTMGNKVAELENEFAKIVGASRSAIAVDSCTSALQLCIEALGLQKAVIAVSPITFAASANVIETTGNIPLFVDVDETGLMDVNHSALDNVDAIMGVHYAGEILDIPKLMERNVPIIEDAAEAHFGKYDDRTYVGGLDNLTCFSFYPTKIIAGAEGGIITGQTADQETWIRKARLHGLSRGAEDRYTGRSSSACPMVEFPGYKKNLTDLSAAIILEQLGRAAVLMVGRWMAVDKYEQAFYELEQKYSFIARKYTSAFGSSVPYIYVIMVDQQQEFIEFMRERDIYCGVHFTSLTTHPWYRNRFEGSCPKAEEFGQHCVSLPLFTDISEEQVDYVIESIDSYCRSR